MAVSSFFQALGSSTGQGERLATELLATGTQVARHMIGTDVFTPAQKKDLHENRIVARGLATTVLVASVAVAILGTLLIAGGFPVLGAIHFIIALPTLYFSYNVTAVSHNIADIIDNSHKYLSLRKAEWDKKAMYKQICQNTFCFGLFNDMTVEALSHTELLKKDQT